MPLPNAPITLTLYGPNDESLKEYSRSKIPWGVLKKAIALTKSIDQENVDEEAMDAIAGLIVEAFGNQFSIQDLDTGSDIGEMMAVLQGIVARAGALVKANPTIAPNSKKLSR